MAAAGANRVWWIAVPLAVVLGVVVSGWLRSAQQPVPPVDNALMARGMRIDASFAGLVDPQGQAVPESIFAGRYRLVAFGFTSCPDICPTMLAGVRQALEKLGADAARVVPVFVSVDPERDPAEKVGRYVGSFDSRILGLTGTPEALAPVAQHYKVYYNKRSMGEGAGNYTIDHTSIIYLIDPGQRIRALVSTDAGPAAVADEIVRAFRALES